MSEHVSVVEDNPANRELLCDWLESEGYQVTAAATLTEACALFAEPLPQIVLRDAQWGMEDGLVLAGWIRDQPSYCEIPVVAVTAHAMVTDQARMQGAGCNSCISKPIDFKGLAVQLDRWLLHARKK